MRGHRRGRAGGAAVVSVACAATFVLAACSFVRDLEYLSDNLAVDAGTDALAVEDRTAPPTPEAAIPPGPVCDAGTVFRPTGFFPFQAPGVAGETPQALACNQENVIEDDGMLANLDRTTNGTAGRTTLAGLLVAGCVGVRFDESVKLTNVAMRIGRVADGCGVSPCLEGADDGCSTDPGLQALLFAGPNENELRNVSNFKFGMQLEVHRERLPETFAGAHVLVVCRSGNVSVTRDDVGVDAIWAECP